GPYEALLLLLLRAVAGAGLLAALDGLGVQGAAHDLVAHAGQVLHTTAADEHDRVLLEVVAVAGDVCGDRGAGRQLHTRSREQRGVLLSRGLSVDARAATAALGRTVKRGRPRGGRPCVASLARQLLDSGRSFSPCSAAGAVRTGGSPSSTADAGRDRT